MTYCIACAREIGGIDAPITTVEGMGTWCFDCAHLYLGRIAFREPDPVFVRWVETGTWEARRAWWRILFPFLGILEVKEEVA